MVYKYVNTEVEVDLDDFDDDELISELESRGLDFNTQYVSGDVTRELLTSIWMNRRLGKPYDTELDQLIYYGLGKVI